MTQLTESFFRNVQTICVTENESALIRYLSNDGLVLLKRIYSTEIHVRFDQENENELLSLVVAAFLDRIKRSSLP